MQQETDSLTFNTDSSQVVFTDVIELQVIDDSVCLTIAVKDRDGKTAKASHRIYMTLEHFFRFSNVCQTTSINIQEEIRKINQPK